MQQQLLPRAEVQWRPCRRAPLTFAGSNTLAAVGNRPQLLIQGEHRSHSFSPEGSLDGIAWGNTRKHRRCFLAGSSLLDQSEVTWNGTSEGQGRQARAGAIPAAQPDLPAGTAPVFPVFPVSRRRVRPLRALNALNESQPNLPGALCELSPGPLESVLAAPLCRAMELAEARIDFPACPQTCPIPSFTSLLSHSLLHLRPAPFPALPHSCPIPPSLLAVTAPCPSARMSRVAGVAPEERPLSC